MVLRRTGLDELPLLVVLGLSATLVFWAGWGGNSANRVQAGPQSTRAEHELGGALSADRLASASSRTGEHVDNVRRTVQLMKVGRSVAKPVAAAQGAVESGALGRDWIASRAEDARSEDDGELRAEGELVDGVPVGRWALYDAEGRRVFTGAFGENGEPVGVWSWQYPDGQVQLEGAFSGGEPSGVWREWYASGAPAAMIEFELGQIDGVAVEWFENGAPRQQGAFDADHRSGLWQSYYPNGQLRARGAYERGLRSGLWEEWHLDGQPMLVASYVRGRAHGLWQAWYSNGQAKERGSFVDGRREGVWHFFDFAGHVDLRTGYYHNGRMVRD